jgi:hypothetical protein
LRSIATAAFFVASTLPPPRCRSVSSTERIRTRRGENSSAKFEEQNQIYRNFAEDFPVFLDLTERACELQELQDLEFAGRMGVRNREDIEGSFK